MPAVGMKRPVGEVVAVKAWIQDIRLGFLASIGVTSANVLQLIIYGLQHRQGYSAVNAGFIGSSDLTGIALGSLVVALFAGTLATRRCVVLGFVFVALLDVASPAITGFWPLAVVRFLNGVAGGATLAALGAAIAASKSPQRVIGATLVIQLSQNAIALIVMPSLIDQWGISAVYFPMAAMALLGLALLPFDRQLLANLRVSDSVRPIGVEHSDDRRKRIVPALSIVALFLFQGSRFMTASYGFAVGEFFRLDKTFVANVLGIATWLGVIGSFGAFLVGGRFGQVLPIVATCALVTVTNIVVIASGHDRMVFMATNSVACVAIFVALPYFLGVCISIDESGRLAVWSHFISVAGLAAGPVLGGWILSTFGMMPLLLTSTALFALAIPVALMPARAIDRAYIKAASEKRVIFAGAD